MLLEGTVTNVAAFGAFVHIGVHHDGLVHVSQLADHFVKDRHEIVKAGDVVKVRVTEVDVARKRIGLSMKREPDARLAGDQPNRAEPQRRGHAPKGGTSGPHHAAPKGSDAGNGALGTALLDAMKRR